MSGDSGVESGDDNGVDDGVDDGVDSVDDGARDGDGIVTIIPVLFSSIKSISRSVSLREIIIIRLVGPSSSEESSVSKLVIG